MVLREFHDKGRRLTGEHAGLLQQDARNDHRRHADKKRRRCNPPRAVKYRACKQGNDRHFRATGDKGGGHNRHFAVAVLLDGARGHDPRHAAAHADQHRDKRLARQAKTPEDTIHDKSNTRHIAAVLKQGEHQEQHEHLGDEANHRANAANDAVHNQADQPARSPNAFQE